MDDFTFSGCAISQYDLLHLQILFEFNDDFIWDEYILLTTGNLDASL